MNWLDLVITVMALVGLIKGLFDGMIKQVVSLFSLVIALFFAGKFAIPICAHLSIIPWISGTIPYHLLNIICYMLAFSLIVLLLHFVGRLLNRAVNVTPVGILNRMLGGVSGVFFIIIGMSLLFMLLSFFDPGSKLIAKQTKQESVLYEKVAIVAPLLYPYAMDFIENQDWDFDLEPDEKERERK